MKNQRNLPFQNEEHNKEPYRKVYDAVSIGPSPISWSIGHSPIEATFLDPSHFQFMYIGVELWANRKVLD
jgi:hypothetical protein